MIVRVFQFFQPKNWSIVKINTLVHETKVKVIDFMYNGKIYKFIGESLPMSIGRGFFLPMKHAFWNGRNVTDYIKPYSGPRNDFYGQEPNLSFIFYKIMRRQWIPRIMLRNENGIGIFVAFEKEIFIEPEDGSLEITNVLGQTSVFGAKKNLMSPKLATE